MHTRDRSPRKTLDLDSVCSAADEDWLDDSPFPTLTRIWFAEPNDLPRRSANPKHPSAFVYALRSAVFSSLTQAEEDRKCYPMAKSSAARVRRHTSLLIRHGSLCPIVFIIQPNDAFTGIRKALLSYSNYALVYEVDLDTEMIQCIPWPSQQWHVPEGGLAAARELRKYAEKVFRSVKHYHDRLRQQGVVDDPSRFGSVDLLSCPKCASSLRGCTNCDMPQVCSRDQCPAAALGDVLSCVTHRDQTYCRDCVENSEPGCAPLAQCPTCNGWYCREELSWCLGIPAPGIGVPRHDTDSGSQRSHPPKPGPCSPCLLWGGEQQWNWCTNADDSNCRSSATRSLSEQWMRDAICPECAPTEPLVCRCRTVQYCRACIAAGHAPDLFSCPRCRTGYCLLNCDYIDKCNHCGRMRFCMDCMEEEDVNGDEDSAHSSATITRRCERCEQSICAACADCKHGVP
ncbi:hypothetical protein F5I97DRAFT_1834584 [Phlebopus sp. FC_14]|nr:hypothetical protein F5I97DRAFT_1834584 [Phlebopus sp. FC_14]